MYCKINGTIVDSGPKLGSQREFGTQWSVHAAHPHETLGGDYFVLCRPYDLTQEPGISGTYNSPWTSIKVYKGTELQWQADLPHTVVSIAHSSDRWLYFNGGTEVGSGYGSPHFAVPSINFRIRNGFMPNPWRNGPDRGLLWMVKHDGSESFPGGKISLTDVAETPLTLGLAPHASVVGTTYTRNGAIACDVVHNSAAVRFSMPAEVSELDEFETDL
jgi:hypothetical protein